MNIIIEGPDGSGKSTLASFLSEKLVLPVVSYPMTKLTDKEFSDLIDKHLAADRMIFDRHRCISEPIYGQMRGHVRVSIYQLQRFYGQRNLFIYSSLLLPHIVKEHDTSEHTAMLEQKSREIATLYRDWAFRCAHILYRGDKLFTLSLIKGIMR